MGTLQAWIEHEAETGRTIGTINNGLQVVRRILNLAAASGWTSEGMTWIQSPQRSSCCPIRNGESLIPWLGRASSPFWELPSHLADMALFAVNTGCRDAEICGLRWDWEVRVPELDTSVFIVPGKKVKNGDDRLGRS